MINPKSLFRPIDVSRVIAWAVPATDGSCARLTTGCRI